MSLSYAKGCHDIYTLLMIQRYCLSFSGTDYAFVLTTYHFAALLLIVFSSIARRLEKLNNEKMTL